MAASSNTPSSALYQEIVSAYVQLGSANHIQVAKRVGLSVLVVRGAWDDGWDLVIPGGGHGPIKDYVEDRTVEAIANLEKERDEAALSAQELRVKAEMHIRRTKARELEITEIAQRTTLGTLRLLAARARVIESISSLLDDQVEVAIQQARSPTPEGPMRTIEGTQSVLKAIQTNTQVALQIADLTMTLERKRLEGLPKDGTGSDDMTREGAIETVTRAAQILQTAAEANALTDAELEAYGKLPQAPVAPPETT